MSLDNVLAVAGAAREHPYVLIFGLGLSIALMAVAASLIARLLQNHRWIAYVGLAVILYVALEMVYRGAYEVGLPSAQSRRFGSRHSGHRAARFNSEKRKPPQLVVRFRSSAILMVQSRSTMSIGLIGALWPNQSKCRLHWSVPLCVSGFLQ